MAHNASSGRFNAFPPNLSATLPSTATSPDPQYSRGSSGTDSVSDDDGSASQLSHPAGQLLPSYGGLRGAYATQYPASYAQNRTESAPATIYVDDPPYNPPGSSRPSHPSAFVETGPDVPFNPPIHTYNSGFPSSMTSTTLPPTTLRRDNGDSSPTGSNGSGGSDRTGGHSGSSQGSASSGVVSNGSPPRDPVMHGQGVFPPRSRDFPFPGFNPGHYPAYDEHFRRVGMEHARFGTDPRYADNAHYRPRTHTYPPVGAPQGPLGMGSPEPLHMTNFPSPEMHLLPMQSDDMAFDRDMRQEPVIPGQTRIQLPSAPPPQSYDNYGHGNASTSHLRVGDDAYIPTSDDDIRRILGLGPDQELSLNALADPPRANDPVRPSRLCRSSPFSAVP
ncbi:hypothetical protein C8Q74DRAFT_1409270 [Fomes fomentarius]|nr:hypothetical protein C8Q74DRAFT_1409270 [Fomes fomentarius]